MSNNKNDNCDNTANVQQQKSPPSSLDLDSHAIFGHINRSNDLYHPSPSPPLLSDVPYEMARDDHHLTNPLGSSSIRMANTNFSSSQNNNNNRSVVYVYELPYNIRKSICDLLDADNSWRELGGRFMGFNDTQLTLISHALYRSASPTNELLTKWESSNAKVSHLFMYLAQMKHHRVMYYLLPFVNKKLRVMYETAGGNQTDYLQSTYKNKNDLLSLSMKEPNFKHSMLKGLVGDNSKFYEYYKNHHSPNHDEEETLIDLQNNTKKAGDVKRTCQDSRNVDYLLKIDDFKISYKELVIATDNFSKDYVLGSGGFGTVFIGDWKGTKVAIKKLKGLDNLTQALTELRILNCCRIDNILPLYAVSLDGPEPCLVYQYMPHGSLEDRLLCKNNTPPLTWIQRAKIGEGVARALNFLHTLKGNPFVHGDVKSANILLDPLFEPKLGDFGLARQVVKNSRNENSIYTHCTVSSVNGTSVYLPAEYLRQKILSPAVDVYSYGIVILEMATGRRAYDGKKLLINSVEDEYSKAQNASVNIQSIKSNEHHNSSNENSLEFLMDKRIANLMEGRHLFNYLLELGRRCAHKTKSKRPIMVQILEYYNQCRATERIHQLCDKVIQNKMFTSKVNISKTNMKNPIELQLWYDFVRKSCGTLSEIVFENFDAQVTKIIEDLVSLGGSDASDSNESKFYLEFLLSSKNKPSLIKSREHDSHDHVDMESSTSLSLQNTDCNLSTMSKGDSNDNLSHLLRLINLDNSNQSSTKNNPINEEAHLNDQIDGQHNEHSTPFIPLLTALGFNTSDIDRLIEQ